MVIVIFAITMLAVMFLGGLWIRSQRKKLQAERQRKLDIASGKIVPAEEKKPPRRWNIIGKWLAKSDLRAKRREKRKKHPRPSAPPWSQHYQPPPPPPTLEEVEAMGRAVIPDAVSRALAAHADYKAQYEAALSLQRSYQGAMGRNNSLRNKLTESVQQGELDEYVQALLQSGRDVRTTNRAYIQATELLPKLKKDFAFALQSLSDRLIALDHKEAQMLEADDELSIEHRHTRDIACSVRDDLSRVSLRDLETDSSGKLPTVPDQEAEQLASGLEPLIDGMFKAARRLAHAYNVTSGEDCSYFNVKNGFELHEPAKPVDADVQMTSDELFTWAERVDSQAAVVSATRPALQAAIDELSAFREQITPAFQRIAEIEKARLEVFKAHLSGGGVRWSRYQTFGEPEPEPLYLSDVSTSLLDAGRRLDEYCQFLLGRSRDIYKSTERMVSTGDEEAPLSEAQSNAAQAVRNAVRKLGFALGQRNAAKLKVEAFDAQPRGERQIRAAQLDEANVDKFVRTFKKAQEDGEFNKQIRAAAQKRRLELTDQLVERKKQVQVAVDALEALKALPVLAPKNANDLPRELRICRLVVDKLVAHLREKEQTVVA